MLTRLKANNTSNITWLCFAKSKLWFGAVLWLCASCSSTPPLDPNQLEFTTRIVDARLKQFKLKFASSFRQDGIPTQEALKEKRLGQRYQAHKAAKRDKWIRQGLHIHLKKLITETGYCKDGYWLIREDIYAQNPSLYGECNDIASAADLSYFPVESVNWGQN